MTQSFLSGFFLGLSLIMAIGSQNAFVLKQGLIGQYTFSVALFCAISDSILIILGVLGMSFFMDSFFDDFSSVIFGLSALWLFIYGLIRLKSAFVISIENEISEVPANNFKTTFSILAILTFVNPHVYLDTMILLGSISQQFIGIEKIAFSAGAILASFIFFFSLAYGAQYLKPLMKNSLAWRILDFLISLIMFTIAFNLFMHSNLF
jgi:L-lysine exporter family protein LysE/ArgO